MSTIKYPEEETKMPLPWLTDAQDRGDVAHTLVQTNAMKAFLNLNQSAQTIIVGSKGYGQNTSDATQEITIS